MVRVRRTTSRAKKSYDFIDDNIDVSLDDELTTGLVPLGDTGLYVTPDEPADPMDCDRYPDSPFCDSNPFTKVPIGLEPEIIINQCDVGIKFSPVLAFVKLPPVHIVHRHEACRGKKDPVIKQPDIDEENDYSLPLSFNAGNCKKGIAGAFCHYSIFYSEDVFLYYNFAGNYVPGKRIVYQERKVEILEINFPYKRHLFNNPNNPLAHVHVKYKLTVNDIYDESIPEHEIYPEVDIIGQPSRVSGDQIIDAWIYEPEGYNWIESSTSGNSFFQAGIYLHPNFYTGIAHLNQLRNYRRSELVGFTTIYRGREYRDFRFYQANFTPIIACEDVNAPPLIDKECCMTCCDDSLLKILLKKVNRLSEVVAVDSYPGKLIKTKPDEEGKLKPTEIEIKDLRELVGQVYSDLEKTSKAIGIDDYPVTLPKSLISKYKNFTDRTVDVLSDIAGAAAGLPDEELSDVKDIPSLTQLFAWYIERFDEIMGQFEIPIEIKDSDPTTPGEQPKGFRLPNIAESIGEIFGLLLQIAMNAETLVNMNTRLAISTTQDMQQNFKTYAMTNAITEWLGFKYKEETQKMPVLFDIGKENIDELLQEKEIDVPVIDFEDKQNFHDTLLKLSEAAAIIKARYFRKLDIKGDMTREIVNLMKGYASNSDKVSGTKDDFDRFIEDAEIGFTNTSGIKDPLNPYGKDFSQRPKIRELGNTSEGND